MKTYLIVYFTTVILCFGFNLHRSIMQDDFGRGITAFITLILSVVAAVCFGKLI